MATPIQIITPLNLQPPFSGDSSSTDSPSVASSGIGRGLLFPGTHRWIEPCGLQLAGDNTVGLWRPGRDITINAKLSWNGLLRSGGSTADSSVIIASGGTSNGFGLGLCYDENLSSTYYNFSRLLIFVLVNYVTGRRFIAYARYPLDSNSHEIAFSYSAMSYSHPASCGLTIDGVQRSVVTVIDDTDVEFGDGSSGYSSLGCHLDSSPLLLITSEYGIGTFSSDSNASNTFNGRMHSIYVTRDSTPVLDMDLSSVSYVPVDNTHTHGTNEEFTMPYTPGEIMWIDHGYMLLSRGYPHSFYPPKGVRHIPSRYNRRILHG